MPRALLAALTAIPWIAALVSCADVPPQIGAPGATPASTASAPAPAPVAPATSAPPPAENSAPPATPAHTVVPLAPSAPPAVPADVEHPHEKEIAAIRRHHLNRTAERQSVAAESLAKNCRYESDIATRPPGRKVALTFDDGPEPGQTEHILDVLRRHRIPATFFMIGEKMRRHPGLVEMVRSQPGATIANHSWDHPNFHEIAVDAQDQEILRGADLVPPDGAPPLFRFPYGNSSCEANAFAHGRGYRIVGWHVDSCDWAFERTGTVDDQEARSCDVEPGLRHDYVGHVLATVRKRDGGIVLLHEIHPNTIRQLEQIVTQLEEEGYVFASLRDEDFQASLR